ncbi:MAG: hypothetical protein IIX31_01515 [Alistipes sp.]|nr:hypothetical protein [Alistipes sp.]
MKMVGEVNKIIYNMLISGRGVRLPQVGTLYIERQGARRISEDRLLSPRNVVAFSSHEEAPSLVDEIVAIAGCQTSQAEDIYERWKSKTLADGVLTIGGVGQLKGKSFQMEQPFNSAINPKGVKTLVVRRPKRRSNSWLYAVCGVCVIVALCICGYIMWGDSLFPKSDTEKVVAAVPAEQVVEATDEEIPAAEPMVSQPEPSVPTATVPAQTPAVQNRRYAYYVVMGVFSTEANADRAIEQVHSKASEAKCEVLPFGSKFMVTMYGSDSREDCNTFARSYRELFPDLWIYNKK